MSIKKVLLIVLVILVVAVCVALAVANSKFQAVTASPMVSHTTLVKPETRVQIVADVPKMRDIIAQQFLKDTGIPPWVLPLALPYEAAVLMDADYALGDMNMTLFINDKRLAPVILDKLNQVKLPPPANAWFAEPMKTYGRGKLLREGSARLNPALVAIIKKYLPDAPVAEPLKVEGGHMIEAVLDNRDGGAMAIIGALAAAQGIDVAGQLEGNDRYEAIPAQIKSLRVQADVTPANALDVHFALDCQKDMAPIILMAVQVGFPHLQEYADMVGIDVQGGSELKGAVIEGNYTVPDFSKLLALAGLK